MGSAQSIDKDHTTQSGGFSSVGFAAAVDSSAPNTEQTPIAFSTAYTFKGIAALVGPVVSSALLQAGQSASFSNSSYGKFGFGAVEIFVGSCAVAGSLSSLAVLMTRPRTPIP